MKQITDFSPFPQGLHTLTSLPVFTWQKVQPLEFQWGGLFVILLHSGELPSDDIYPICALVSVLGEHEGLFELH